MRKFFGRDLWITSNFALLIVVLVVVGLLVTACVVNTAQPTEIAAPPTVASSPSVSASMPTDPPASTLEPTAVPTEVSTPTTTPTEVPMYVGLPASDVETLRAQCLQENPNSPCLPLPFGPASDAEIKVVSDFREDPWVTVSDGKDGDQYLEAGIPVGTELLSPLAGEVWVRGTVPSYGYRWLGLPGRKIEGLSMVSFGFGPFVDYSWDSDWHTEPSVELTLIKGECQGTVNGKDGVSPVLFEEGDLGIPDPSRDVRTGELLVQTKVQTCLRITRLVPVLMTITLPPGLGSFDDGSQHKSGLNPFGRIELSDLLTTDAGSIVYVLPNEK